jgi:ATP-dependent RNA helicase DHR2
MELSELKRKRDDGNNQVQLPNFKKQKLLQARKQLPIWERQRVIRELVRANDVLVLSGETGSGKSTQVPQFLLQSLPILGKIAVTQPRRVAAITLARRVADEMGTPCGSSSPASKVGYSVRFDESTSPSTRIKFLTEGMLLQEMLRDPLMDQYSCIIVDEVHERSINVDLILGFLKTILTERRRKKMLLKIVIMSATADVEAVSKFFAQPSGGLSGQSISNGDHFNGENGTSEDSWDGFSDDETKATPVEKISTALCHVEGRQFPVQLNYLDKPTEDVIESALVRIFQIHRKEPMPGDILVFMTGQESIQGLQKILEEYAEQLTLDFPKMLVLPLFAALPQSAQQRVFQPAPPNTRKVILSTNIAETSVTVAGVRFVVDTGKAKIKKFHNRLGLEALLIKPISRSSADQRKGRAGREAPGTCYRLYTESSFNELDKDNTPEILRCDLAEALLKMKARGVDDVLNFPFLSPPPQVAVEKALLLLHQLGAVDDHAKITETGRHMSRLPLTPSLGRVIVEAARLDCLLQVIDIVACLSVENIFLNVETEEAKEQAQAARQQLFCRQGDHLTLLAAVQAYAYESVDRRRWADDHLVSHRAMRNVMDVRKQLREQCKTAKLLPKAAAALDSKAPSEVEADNILKAFLHGFKLNLARLCLDGSYKTLVGNHVVAIHPSSVLFGKKLEAIVYNEFVYTNKAYARGVSAVQMKWISELFL